MNTFPQVRVQETNVLLNAASGHPCLSYDRRGCLFPAQAGESPQAPGPEPSCPALARGAGRGEREILSKSIERLIHGGKVLQDELDKLSVADLDGVLRTLVNNTQEMLIRNWEWNQCSQFTPR